MAFNFGDLDKNTEKTTAHNFKAAQWVNAGADVPGGLAIPVNDKDGNPNAGDDFPLGTKHTMTFGSGNTEELYFIADASIAVLGYVSYGLVEVDGAMRRHFNDPEMKEKGKNKVARQMVFALHHPGDTEHQMEQWHMNNGLFIASLNFTIGTEFFGSKQGSIGVVPQWMKAIKDGFGDKPRWSEVYVPFALGKTKNYKRGNFSWNASPPVLGVDPADITNEMLLGSIVGNASGDNFRGFLIGQQVEVDEWRDGIKDPSYKA